MLIESLFVWGTNISHLDKLQNEHLNFFKTTTRENLQIMEEETKKVRRMGKVNGGKVEGFREGDDGKMFRETEIRP
jgi:hypothetical protein